MIDGLKRTRGKNGKPITGLWESNNVRAERVPGGWECAIPMRQIGGTNHYEYRPLNMGGKWQPVGVMRTLKMCDKARELLESGAVVLRGAYSDSEGPVPLALVSWTSVKDDIAQHPSVTGEFRHAPPSEQ